MRSALSEVKLTIKMALAVVKDDRHTTRNLELRCQGRACIRSDFDVDGPMAVGK